MGAPMLIFEGGPLDGEAREVSGTPPTLHAVRTRSGEWALFEHEKVARRAADAAKSWGRLEGITRYSLDERGCYVRSGSSFEEVFPEAAVDLSERVLCAETHTHDATAYFLQSAHNWFGVGGRSQGKTEANERFLRSMERRGHEVVEIKHEGKSVKVLRPPMRRV